MRLRPALQGAGKLLALALLAWVAPGLAHARDQYPIFYSFVSPKTGKTYTIVQLILNYPEIADEATTLTIPTHKVTAEEHAQAAYLRKRLYDFVYDEIYKPAWPALPASFFDEMRKKDLAQDSPAEIIGVFEGASLEKPVATFEYAFTDEEHPLLPLETAMRRRYLRQGISYGDYPALARSGKPGHEHLDTFMTDVLQGTPTELKKFAVSPRADKAEDLAALVFLYSASTACSRRRRGRWYLRPSRSRCCRRVIESCARTAGSIARGCTG